ncbi:MAG: hypothetical protein R3E02_12525 [Blastomonas sp.]
MTQRQCLAIFLAAAIAACTPGLAQGDAPDATGDLATAEDIGASDELGSTGLIADALHGAAIALDAEPGPQSALELAGAARKLERLSARPLDEDGQDLVAGLRNEAMTRDPALKLAPLRGRAIGPGYRQTGLAAGDSDRLEQIFLAGERAKLALSPMGNARLRLKVTDADGKTVCRLTISEKRAGCAWTPLFTTRHTITVENISANRAKFFLVVD